MEGKMVMISGKIYQIKEQLYRNLYLVEEMEVIEGKLVHTGSEFYFFNRGPKLKWTKIGEINVIYECPYALIESKKEGEKK